MKGPGTPVPPPQRVTRKHPSATANEQRGDGHPRAAANKPQRKTPGLQQTPANDR